MFLTYGLINSLRELQKNTLQNGSNLINLSRLPKTFSVDFEPQFLTENVFGRF